MKMKLEMTQETTQETANAPPERLLRRNLLLIIGVSFFHVFSLIMPVIVPIFESRGLDLGEILLLQAIFGFGVASLEVPSGYLSDLIGRKLTLLIGSIFYGSGTLLLYFSEGFAMLVGFELCMAVAVSLISGADLALLYDTELAIGGLEGRRPKAVRRLFLLDTLSAALASVLSGVLLALDSLEVLIGVQALVAWLPLFVCLGVYEPARRRLSTRRHGENFALISRLLLSMSPVLRFAFLSLAFWSLSVFFVVWLLQKQWQLFDIPLQYFGYLWAVLSLVSALSGQISHGLVRLVPASVRLGFIALVPVVGYLGLAVFGPVIGFFAAILVFMARGLGIVLLRDAVNSRIPSEIRATVNSLANFGFRIAFALVGPLVGYVFELGGMRITWLLVAAGSLALNTGLILPLILAVRAEKGKPVREIQLAAVDRQRRERRLAKQTAEQEAPKEPFPAQNGEA